MHSNYKLHQANYIEDTVFENHEAPLIQVKRWKRDFFDSLFFKTNSNDNFLSNLIFVDIQKSFCTKAQIQPLHSEAKPPKLD